MKSKEEKEDPRALNGRKVAKNRDFPMICGLGGSQKKLAKAAGAEPCGQRRNEKIACHCGAKRTLKSNVQSASFGPLLEVPTSNIARCCGTKHIFKSKC